MLISLFAMSLRGLGLVARFGLVIYLAKYLSLADVGAFGLVSGAVGMAPAVVGWGINYFLGREVVDQSLARAGPMIRDRLLLSALSLAAAAALLALASAAGLIALPPHALLIAAIVVLDGVAFDVHMALVGLRKLIFANAVLFLRSSAWAFPVIGLGIIDPALRTFEFVLWMWLSGLLLSYALMAWELRRWPVAEITGTPLNPGKVKGWLLSAPLIYLNDIAIVGVLYLDRYVVNHFLGLEMAGIFTLYWSIANGLHVLMHSGFLQMAIPRLVSSATGEHRGAWRHTLWSEFKKVTAGSIALSVVLFGAVAWMLPALGITKASADTSLFAIMLAANVVRLGSDLLNYGIYSWKLDRQLALINLASLAVSIFCSIVGTASFKLLGAGVAMLLSAIIVLVWRAEVLRRHWVQPATVA